MLPVDLVAADELRRRTPTTTWSRSTRSRPTGMGLDIGPATRELFAAKLADARTVFWNGPMGVFEFPAFAAGTRAVAQALTEVDGLHRGRRRRLGRCGTVARASPTNAFGHISTGGGASLEYLEGKTLPGLTALED